MCKSNQPSINFQFGFDDGLEGKRYQCPSQGNQKAEIDYALGWEAGDIARKMLTK